jgi:hypothetical protein
VPPPQNTLLNAGQDPAASQSMRSKRRRRLKEDDIAKCECVVA